MALFRSRATATAEPGQSDKKVTSRGRVKLGTASGVYVPVILNIVSVLMFLRFGIILGQVGYLGILGLLVVAYCVDLLTVFSLSAIASNGEVKGGGAYYLISRSLGPEFGGSIGILFFLAQTFNAALNVVGLFECLRLNAFHSLPQGYWERHAMHTGTLVLCTGFCLLGTTTFARASNALLAVLSVAILSIPISACFKTPFHDESIGVNFTGLSFDTLASNFLPHRDNAHFDGVETFRDLFTILFPATTGILAGAARSGLLQDPSRAIPKGTVAATITTFFVYAMVALCLAASVTRDSFIARTNIISTTSLAPLIVLAGECVVTVFSVLMGIMGAATLFQALAKDHIIPGLSTFAKTSKSEEPVAAILLAYVFAQLALFADLNSIAALISMGYQMTFLVMNVACFLLSAGSAPNFRPTFKFFSWQTACIGSLLSIIGMFFVDVGYAAIAIISLVAIFLFIHYTCPPKRWGDVSQNLIYHQLRKYLLRLKPEHIKFWRPHIILFVNNPRSQDKLVQFCNSLKKGSLYILGHVIITNDFSSGLDEARIHQQAWAKYISEYSKIKAFIQLNISPSLLWGFRNLILSAGLGGMRPNIGVIGFYNMKELRDSRLDIHVPERPTSGDCEAQYRTRSEEKFPDKDTASSSTRLLQDALPTDGLRTEGMMSPTEYVAILEDLALQYKLNVAVAHGFDQLGYPILSTSDKTHKRYIDLWPIQMSAEVMSDGENVLTTNFDTYTLILQLGYILASGRAWKKSHKLRVMIFVEYESEMVEAGARVRSLLSKLRIDAIVKVFWLACGELNTYELIINGICKDVDWERVVDDVLRHDEWWDDLQAFRGRAEDLSASQEFEHLSKIISHSNGLQKTEGLRRRTNSSRRRPSLAGIADIVQLSELGVSLGMHTNYLGDQLFQDNGDDVSSEDSEFSESDEENSAHQSNGKSPESLRPRSGTYGTMTQESGRIIPSPSSTQISEHPVSLISQAFQNTARNSVVSDVTLVAEKDHSQGSSKRRAHQRSKSETITLSRQSTFGRFSSRPVPEATAGTAEDGMRTITFAEHPTVYSQRGSISNNHTPKTSSHDLTAHMTEEENDLSSKLPSSSKLKSNSYPNLHGHAGSAYSTQGVSLSFNDLPSRAQHLILNELMRNKSSETAVLFSTLPIPSKGTSLDEVASVQYLSDVEVFCNELPPTMMILSNTLNFTVSL